MSRFISVGADPEVFLFDTKAQQLVSGHLIPLGDKFNPTRTEFGAVQNDGVALEFNIDPATNEAMFLSNIQSTMEELRKKVRETHEFFSIEIRPTARFNPQYFKTIPAHVKALGCVPDYNAYLEAYNPRPATKLPM